MEAINSVFPEGFKAVEGYDGYAVNSSGDVMSTSKNGKPTIINGWINRYGYKNITIGSRPNQKNVRVHRLVAAAFVPNTYSKPFVNHINGIKTDNRAENLEWCTHGENLEHAGKNGLMHGLLGERNHFSKLTAKDVLEIRCLSNLPSSSLAAKYNVARSTINRIRSKRTWGKVAIETVITQTN